MSAQRVTPTPSRPILAVNRQTGAFVALVASCSQPGAYHVVTADGRCDCKSFAYRKHCRHIDPAQTERRAANAATYRAIWGSDEGGDAA